MFLIALFDKTGQRCGYLRKTLKVLKGDELVPGVRIAVLKEDAHRFDDAAAAARHMATLPAVTFRVVERDDPPRRTRTRLRVAA